MVEKSPARMKHSGMRNYQPISDHSESEDANGHESVIIHVVPENKSRWNHIEDLDAFFTRVYHYHQQHGFACMMLQEFLELVQFIFVVCFSAFLLKCVDYKILFRETPAHLSENRTKITINDVVYAPGQCVPTFGPVLWSCLLVAFIFWILRLVSVIYHLFQYWEMRSFYQTALHISDSDLDNLTWHEVQQRLRTAQRDFQMCIHKQDLTELDIYHRILRFKNYMVAMVNKSVLPLKFNVPFLGETVFLTRGLKYNLQFLLFWGPWAPFENSWHLRDDYKRPSKRRELAQKLSKNIYYLGIFNLCLAPLIMLWQVLYAFFSYAEIVKREPGTLGSRRWSLYGRLYLRHFNELDHELQTRLSRAYRPATHYLSGFTSNLMSVIARNLAFLAGAVLAVLVILTIYDEDVITVEHVLSIMTILGAVVAGCRVLIPEENLVWCPESLMEAILAQVHYLPTSWKGQAHTAQVRKEFAQLFQYKAVYLLEEMISPLVTPFILCCALRYKAIEIVDFLRHFTVEVVGVGDVCSFAQLDLHKHGHPHWQSSIPSEILNEHVESASQHKIHPSASQTHDGEHLYKQAEDGKTELSLIHFALTNPEWRPPRATEDFLNALRSQIQQELVINPAILQPSILASSFLPGGAYPYSTMMQSIVRPTNYPNLNLQSEQKAHPLVGRGITRSEGSRTIPENRSFIRNDGSGHESLHPSLEGTAVAQPVSLNMAISTLYLHDVVQRRNQPPRRNLTSSRVMPGIRESPDEALQASGAAITAAELASLAAAAVEHMPLNAHLSKSNYH